MVWRLGRRLHRHARRWQLAAWLLLPACVLLYVWSRIADFPAADVVRVCAFMVPVSLAMLGSLLCWHESSAGSVGRLMWGSVAVATAFLFASEAYYGVYQLAVDMGGPPAPSLFDALNLAAALSFFGILASLTRLRYATAVARAQILAAALVFVVVGYTATYRYFAAPLAVATGHSARYGVVWAVYATIGGLLFLGCAWGVVRHRGTSWVTWQTLVLVSISAFSLVVLLWPVRYLSAVPAYDAPADLLLAVGYMVGYHLFFMAGVYWLTAGTAPWTSASEERARTVSARASIVVTTFALATLPLLTLAFYRAAPGTVDRDVYFAALVVTTIAVVVRTSLSDVESAGLRKSASADPLTSISNRTTFGEELRDAIARAETHAAGLSLAVVDIDDFARFNVVHGREEGDAALVAIARSLRETAGLAGSAARLGGDEFAVVLEGLATAGARSRLRQMLQAIERSAQGPESIALSAGMSSWPEDGLSAEELLAAADAALYWAKYQGKHRLEVYDETVVRALDAEERIRGLAHKSRSDIVRALAAATDARDSATAYHSRQVAALALLVAESAGLGSGRVQDVQMAALLHDVGKVAVPDSVLRKRSRLSPGERAVYMEHAELGARILAGTELAYMAPWVRAHHEHWDGSGYPDGIAGPAIPLEARIIAACDVYDQMVSGTPERGPLSRSAAIQELDRNMGCGLDPDVAEILIEVVGQGRAVGWSEAWLS